MGDTDQDSLSDKDDKNLSSEDEAASVSEEGKKKFPATFPQKLMKILSNEDVSDIISWLPHGRGFIIYQKKQFSQQIMPKYFKKVKFTSFTRKLNRWSFVRITRGPETGAYYNEFFQRDDHRLCLQMRCRNSAAPQTSVGFPGMASPGAHGYQTELTNTPNETLSTTARVPDLSSLRPALDTLHNQIVSLQNYNENPRISIQKLRNLERERELLLIKQHREQQLRHFKLKCLEEEIKHQTHIIHHTLNEGTPSSPKTKPDHAFNSVSPDSDSRTYLDLLMTQAKIQQTPLPAPCLGRGTSEQSILLQLKQQYQHREQYSQLLQAQAAIQQQKSAVIASFAGGVSKPLYSPQRKQRPTKKTQKRKFSAAA
mmetsp:Transcript_28849/g.43561  ORF Transcript_28849/g.43561 Transcript_28849/m.43561 type:complete len:369 (+) Transcript_28849:79-1185(+)